MSYVDIPAGVVVLSFPVSPSTVFWTVVSVIVDPIQRHALWAVAHILKERGIVVPPGADFDSTSAIPMVLPLSWHQASVTHPHPDPVSSGLLGLGCKTMPCFVLSAAAGFSVSARECTSPYDRRFSTITLAKPLLGRVLSAFAKHGKRYQIAKPLASYIKSFHKSITSILVNNHWRARSNRVIEVLLSAAKPSYAGAF